jgi:hypothetical protein
MSSVRILKASLSHRLSNCNPPHTSWCPIANSTHRAGGRGDSCPCVYLLKQQAMKTCGVWRHTSSSTFLGIVTWRRWTVSLTSRPLYRLGKSLPHSLERKLVGPHRRSGRCGAEKKTLVPAGTRNRAHHYSSFNASWHFRLQGFGAEYGKNSMKSFIRTLLYQAPLSTRCRTRDRIVGGLFTSD